ncbi:hypothetical protein T06_10190 [Trichinella sp. T6]|nr:hypothetical protein T06_10190 [Trichinella sp. T6]
MTTRASIECSTFKYILKVLQHLKYRKIVVNNTEFYYQPEIDDTMYYTRISASDSEVRIIEFAKKVLKF